MLLRLVKYVLKEVLSALDCLLIGWLRDETEMAAWACGGASFIGSNDLFQKLEIEQWQLNDASDAANAASRRIRRHPPVEEPLMGTQIDQG
jgi:hypothetical protein